MRAPVFLLFFDPDDFAASVGSAVRAHAVRCLRLPTLRTGAPRGNSNCIVRPPFVALGLGRTPLGNSHHLPPGARSSRIPASTANGESDFISSQSQRATARFAPHRAHRPGQSSRHSGFTGSVNEMNSTNIDPRWISLPRNQPVSNSSPRHKPSRDNAAAPSGSAGTRFRAGSRTNRNSSLNR